MKAIDWVTRVQGAHGGLTDYQTAKILGVKKQAISKMRAGQVRTLADETCYHVAQELGIDPMEVIADQGAERAKSDHLKTFWQRIAKSVAAAILAIGISTYPIDVYAKTSVATQDAIFIIRNWLRRMIARKQLANAM